MPSAFAGAAARIAALALIVVFSASALADPPTRAIRLAYTSGAVSFLPSGESQWVQARINRPLWMGDRLWSDRGARAELQLGGAALFFAPQTNVSVLDFDDRHAQFEITQGAMTADVRSLGNGDTIEIDTPNLAFVVQAPGRYRIDVDESGQSTAVTVLRGEGQAFGTNAAYVLRTGNRFRFFGNDLTDYDAEPIATRDPFDAWVASRVSARDRSVSARYVSADTIGYADLDNYGTWRTVGDYGPVWVPTQVAADWAPYRYGHWTWVDPWGWTWVDDASWGFAPFHYGRWAYIDNRYWGWVPGPRQQRPVYAPALVAFVGGDNFRITAGSQPSSGIAWFPLAPGEVYRPAYNASREYFTRINVANTAVNATNVTSAYNNPRGPQARYRNVENANAVTVVPTQAFVQAQPVQRAAVRVERAQLQSAPIVANAPVAPARVSVAGAAGAAKARPPEQAMQRAVVARQAPPAAPPSIERREAELKQQPGKPLDQPDLGRNAQAAPPNVRVVQAPAAAQPIPPAPPAGAEKAGERRARNAPAAQPAANAAPPPSANAAPPQQQQQAQPQRAQPVPEQRAQPAPPPPTAAAPAPAPPVTAQPAPEQRRGPPEGRGRFNQREEPAAKAPEPQPPRAAQAAPPPPQSAQPAAPPPQVAQPAPAAPVAAQPAPEQRRGPPEGRNAFNPRAEPAARAAPPAPATPAAAAPPAVPPRMAAPSAAPAPQPQPSAPPPAAAAPPPQPSAPHPAAAAAPAPHAAPAAATPPQPEPGRRGERGPPPGKGKDSDEKEKGRKE